MSDHQNRKADDANRPASLTKLRDLFSAARAGSGKAAHHTTRVLGKRQAAFGSAFAASVFSLLGILIILNVLAYRGASSWRIDLTQDRQFSLSGQTRKVLQDLDGDIKVLGFYSPQYPNAGSVQNLLEEYRTHSNGYLTYEIVNPQRSPALARQYTVTREGTLVFVKGDRQESVIGTTETDLTRGLVKITRDRKRTVVFVTGHGEKDPLAQDQNGYASLNQFLTGEGYEVKTVALLGEDIPEGTDVLVIAGPQNRFAGNEVDKVTKYVDAGGRLFLMVDPASETQILFTDFDGLLAKYGAKHQEGTVIDPKAYVLDVQSPVVQKWESHQITEDLGNGFFAGTSGVGEADAPIAGFKSSVLARSSDASWLEMDRASAQVSKGPDDTTGPVPMGVAIEPVAEQEGQSLAGKPRLVVLGDSDFAIDLFMQVNPLNQDLFLNAVSWLADEDDLISIRPKDTQPRIVSFTKAQGDVIFWTLIAGLPGLAIAAGIATFVVRRKRTS